jgi:hypothetical protein
MNWGDLWREKTMTMDAIERRNLIGETELKAFKKVNKTLIDGCRNCKHSTNWDMDGIGNCKLLANICHEELIDKGVFIRDYVISVDNITTCNEWVKK